MRAGGDGNRPRHTVRPGVWCGTAPSPRRAQAVSGACAHSAEHPGRRAVGLRQQDPLLVRPGPGDRHRRGELCPVADPIAVRVRTMQCHVRFLQMQRLVLPVMLCSGTAALGPGPPCCLLAAGEQARSGQQRRGSSQCRLLPG
uniref:Uncharacterized protein n=1 Tax=Setaria viridis TaxID=4556 RepID=A0A4U6WCE3_SETVI|nr:hypothetical protein SEVIR_1G129965v2 [Setaria viridis]